MMDLLESHFRLVIWAIGATGVIAELAALALFAQPAVVALPEQPFMNLAGCAPVTHYEALPLRTSLPRELSL